MFRDRASVFCSFNRSPASRPFIRGIPMSTTITSGLSCGAVWAALVHFGCCSSLFTDNHTDNLSCETEH